MDEQLKSDLDKLCEQFGMNTSVAINIFARAVVRERRIPFEITANQENPGVQIFNALRMQAKNKGVQGMSLDNINSEINRTRSCK
jgi:addiction module RelB/DinJ family antitoxin